MKKTTTLYMFLLFTHLSLFPTNSLYNWCTSIVQSCIAKITLKHVGYTFGSIIGCAWLWNSHKNNRTVKAMLIKQSEKLEEINNKLSIEDPQSLQALKRSLQKKEQEITSLSEQITLLQDSYAQMEKALTDSKQQIQNLIISNQKLTELNKRFSKNYD